MDITYHFPPDLLHLLEQTIPKLCRSKKQTILFFRGAGVGQHITDPLARRVAEDKDSISKYEIVNTILTKLNEMGETTLGERREVVRRVVEFEDFTSCFPSDALAAEGLVARVRSMVNVKDSFTKMQQEEEKHRLERAKAKRLESDQIQKKANRREELKKNLYSLFSEKDPVKRGKLLESALNELFRHEEILISEAFTRKGDNAEGVIEQIDGVIQLDGEFYLVEMKWWNSPLGPGEVSQHMVRVFGRGQGRGLFISASGYTPAAVASCRDNLHAAVFVLCDLEELVRMLESGSSLRSILAQKVRAAVVHKNPYHRPEFDM